MNKGVTIFLILLIAFNLSALKNWKNYTNTSHIYDIEEYNNKVYVATWGGLTTYDPGLSNYGEVITTIGGLANNEINTLANFDERNELLIGSLYAGIDRYNGSDFMLPLNELAGLASNNIYEVVCKDSLVFAATDLGLSIFLNSPEFPYPLPIMNIDSESGLSADKITSVQVSENGFVFCGGESGIDVIEIALLEIENSWMHFDADNSDLPSSMINDIHIRDELVAVGTRAGLAYFYTTELNNMTVFTNAELENDISSVFPVFIDLDFSIYAGAGYWHENEKIVKNTTDVAFFKIENDAIENFWMKNDLSLRTTQIMGFENIDEDLYCFTWGEGILVNQNGSWSLPQKKMSIQSKALKDLEFDEDNVLWVSDGHKGSLPTANGTKGIASFDGETWQNYYADAAGLGNNNIYTISVDDHNRKWFGAWGGYSTYGWSGGISIYDDSNNSWEYLNSSNELTNNTISFITSDDQNRQWICCYGGSSGLVNILENDNRIHEFELYDYNLSYPAPDMDPNYVFLGNEKIFVGGWLSGLRIWNNTIDPVTDGDDWSKTPFSDLHASQIFDITSSDIYQEKIWIASTSGLFMFDGSDWYLFGATIKKKKWLDNSWFWSDGIPNPEYWYYEGQDRLYGSQTTYPTALLIDPFGILWVGTADAGITAFDIEKEVFTTYSTQNSSLLSNNITDLAYDRKNGLLYIATNEGLNSVQIGISGEMNTETDLNNILCYPNPFYPENGEILRIENQESISMPQGKVKCRIYALDGSLIAELEKDQYQQFSWDGNNLQSKKCSSGIYFYLVSSPDGQIGRGKFALIR